MELLPPACYGSAPALQRRLPAPDLGPFDHRKNPLALFSSSSPAQRYAIDCTPGVLRIGSARAGRAKLAHRVEQLSERNRRNRRTARNKSCVTTAAPIVRACG